MDVGKHLRVKVRGVSSGQSVINVLHYLNTSSADPTSIDAIADAFRAQWRSWVLPRVVNRYSVLYYDFGVIDGLVWDTSDGGVPGDTDGNTLWRYTENVSLAGTGSDVGSVAGAGMPTFNAVGYRKVCAGWEEPDNLTPIPLTKSPRGSLRLSGVPEDATTFDNILDTGPLADFTATGNALRTIVSGSVRLDMILVTNRIDGNLMFGGAPAFTPEYGVAFVTAMAVNRYITSQTSRKQNVHRLG